MIQIQNLTLPPPREQRGCNEAIMQLAKPDPIVPHVDEKGLEEIRRAVNHGWPLGSERFKDQIERALERAARPPKRGRPSMQRNLVDVPAD